MTWNYRVMHYPEGHPAFAPNTHGIHEVYYSDGGSVSRWTEDPVPLVGGGPEDLEWRVQAMLEALPKPALEYEPDGRSSV